MKINGMIYRALLSLSFCTLVALGFSQVPEDYAAQLQQERLEKDEHLKSRKESPLQKADRKAFTHLHYFNIDPEWRLEVEFDRTEDGEVIDMPTSAGVTKKFAAYGRLLVYVNDMYFPLVAYKRIWPEDSPYKPAPGEETLFVPFKDITTGESTYGGGRYMDLEVPKDGDMIVLDFNTCYNPYCAYGGGFSCPIPPEGNFLKVAVEAGEKAYAH